MPLRYNQGVPPLSSRYLPPGSDYADQFSDSSVLRHGDTPSKKERWQSQAGSYRRPSTEGAVATASVNWAGAFATAVKHQPENVPHHSCNFYRDRFHILGELGASTAGLASANIGALGVQNTGLFAATARSPGSISRQLPVSRCSLYHHNARSKEVG